MSIKAGLVFLVFIAVLALVSGPGFRKFLAWLLGIPPRGRR